jgi:membrane-associated phospholipid phosphatase
MYVKIKSFWDFISATILLSNYIIIYESFDGNIELPLGVILTLTLEKIGKLITGKWYPAIFARPHDACDCSIFNDGGAVGGNPGFPSGHVAMASYFAYVMVFKYFENNYYNLLIATLFPIIIGMSRYFKRCHNIYQIFAGWLLGIGVALFIKYIIYHKNKEKIK